MPHSLSSISNNLSSEAGNRNPFPLSKNFTSSSIFNGVNSNRNKHILVIEDDTVILEYLSKLLEWEGYLVQCASNGSDALKLLQSVSPLPGLILLDLAMPIMDGFQFREAQESDGRIAVIPVVIMTADRNVESKSMKIGAKDFVKKPLDFDDVLSTILRYYLN
ncbi:MAG: response regulator [Bdellovibrionia bacterium]